MDVDDASDLTYYVDADGIDDVHGDREAHDPFSRHSEGEGVWEVELSGDGAKEGMAAAAASRKRVLILVQYSEQEGNPEGMAEAEEGDQR